MMDAGHLFHADHVDEQEKDTQSCCVSLASSLSSILYTRLRRYEYKDLNGNSSGLYCSVFVVSNRYAPMILRLFVAGLS